jgi:3-oxoacyl-[acyl-carrier-protein] synthase-3
MNGSPAAMEKPYLTMKSGPSVLRNAVNAMADSVWRVLGYRDGGPGDEERGKMLSRMRVVPHQANGRIVDGLAKKLGATTRQVTKTIYKYGNISAASNVIALDYAMRNGNLEADKDAETGEIREVREVKDPVRKGDLVVLPSIGAGYLFGAVAFVA